MFFHIALLDFFRRTDYSAKKINIFGGKNV